VAEILYERLLALDLAYPPPVPGYADIRVT
jgi:hypothetical protein